MIRVSISPAASSALRMAPTRPSIMSEGPSTSIPASACTNAWLHQSGDAVIVVHVAVPKHAVMAMGGVEVERHVPHQADIRVFAFQQPCRLANQVVGVGRLGAVRVLQLGRRRREQGYQGDAQVGCGRDVGGEAVHAHALARRAWRPPSRCGHGPA